MVDLIQVLTLTSARCLAIPAEQLQDVDQHGKFVRLFSCPMLQFPEVMSCPETMLLSHRGVETTDQRKESPHYGCSLTTLNFTFNYYYPNHLDVWHPLAPRLGSVDRAHII